MVSPKGTALKADVAEIRRTLDLLLEPGQVAELRALNTRRGTAAGNFTDFDKLAQHAAHDSGIGRVGQDFIGSKHMGG